MAATAAAVAGRQIFTPAAHADAPLNDAASPVSVSPAKAAPRGIEHLIVIYLENHSFDNLFGTFPGADGIANAGAAGHQRNKLGALYPELPRILTGAIGREMLDPRFPVLPNTPFQIDKFVPNTQKIRDLVHGFYEEQQQIDGGKMDMFAAVSDAAGLVMGYYDGSKTRLWDYARQYVLADHFFHAAFGGSLLNHFWLVAAQTPAFPDAPDRMRAQLDSKGRLLKDGPVSPDGFVINNLYSQNTPHPVRVPADQLLPPLTIPHIGDRLDARGVSWGWFSGGWNDAITGRPDPSFYYVCQPLAYFANLGDGSDARAAHLHDEQDFLTALSNRELPNVSFVKPLQPDCQHPGEADIMRGDAHTASLIDAVQHSDYWDSSAIIVTYDEHGGFWDHVTPPAGDRWGPGIRVPAVIISPFAKRGFIDSTVYDTTSILAFLESHWRLEPLTQRDATANNLMNAFEL